MAHLNTAEKQHLLALARHAISAGLQGARLDALPPADLQGTLGAQGASFVTLTINDQLRGCIGSLIAHRPLAFDVVHNAYAAGFEDHRFPPLTDAEFNQVELKISVLSPAEPISFFSEEDLLSQLNPGEDGLILSAHGHRGTFLPAVWREVPEPRDFLDHLKMKAGLPADYWADDIVVERYTTDEFW